MVGGGCEYHAKWHGKSLATRKQYFNSISCNIVGSCSEMLWRSWPNERNILQHPKMLQKKKIDHFRTWSNSSYLLVFQKNIF